ncbi:hypothetical protein [Halotia branconii]|uniref:Uncharacterized protein n=1 Tax=Halotia branconii CENA392 TaxID=1539056 RepID=A0AAJ6NRW7_9CYAN|nr:hypothetical protein [Halotia branconii]WGV25433.1 hypothetical protein QI031_27470 [Halotia branconii CENA392]
MLQDAIRGWLEVARQREELDPEKHLVEHITYGNHRFKFLIKR